MPTSVRTPPPPSSVLTSAPTPPPRLLSLRPILAGLAILAIGVPAVLALPGTGTRGPAHPITITRSAIASPPVALVQHPGPAEGPSIPAPRKATPRPVRPRPAPSRHGSASGHRPGSGKSRPESPTSAPPKSAAWVRAECARRYPAHDPRRAACMALLNATFGH